MLAMRKYRFLCLGAKHGAGGSSECNAFFFRVSGRFTVDPGRRRLRGLWSGAVCLGAAPHLPRRFLLQSPSAQPGQGEPAFSSLEARNFFNECCGSSSTKCLFLSSETLDSFPSRGL